MSKPIKITGKHLEECRADFEIFLQSAQLSDGMLSFSKSFACENRKAVVRFTPGAWAKMAMLIDGFDKEVAWHGVTYRVEDESKNEYHITDILVYPQEVTGSTVEMDTEKYALWLMENAEDERFNHIRMQGHSHVNMSPDPSGVDLRHQRDILKQLGADDFYIFMILNKSFASNVKIYDLKKNILFENGDISIQIDGEDDDLDKFFERAKVLVKNKPRPATQYKPSILADHQYDEDKKDSKRRVRIGAGWMGARAFHQSESQDKDGVRHYDISPKS